MHGRLVITRTLLTHTSTLLYLQLILQMQTQLATDDSASSILNKPDHILSFIKHALESAASPIVPRKKERRSDGGGLHLEDLRIVEEAEDAGASEGDSDDEEPQSDASTDDEMVTTSLNLLLSILEGKMYANGSALKLIRAL